MAFPLSRHSQELLGNQPLHLLLGGIAVACDCLGDQSRQKLPAKADFPDCDRVKKVVDDVLVILVHQGDSGGHGMRPISRPPSSASKNRAENWRRRRLNPWLSLEEKSHTLRRARIPSSPGVRHRRRNWLARGANPVHAAGEIGAIPTLPTAAEWSADELGAFRG